MFTSIERYFRGFTFSRSYKTKEEYNDEIISDIEENREINWSYLFDEEGNKVAEYRRGYTMAEYR